MNKKSKEERKKEQETKDGYVMAQNGSKTSRRTEKTRSHRKMDGTLKVSQWNMQHGALGRPAKKHAMDMGVRAHLK